MKRTLFLVTIICVHFVLKAQKTYFVYLQSESATPFYVKMAGKIQSSTAEGYLILPKLKDSTYLITIGQPGKQDEPKFTITVSRGDRGFLIKNFNESLGLFDLQTLAVYKPITVENAAPQTVAKTDNFTKLLAKAADDTTLLTQSVVVAQTNEKPKEKKPEEVVVKEESKDPETVKPSNSNTVPTFSPSKDSIVQQEPVISSKEEIKREDAPQKIEEEFKRSIITKKKESSTSEGFGLVFLDAYNGQVDTVDLIIPNSKIIGPDSTEKQPTEKKQCLEINEIKKDTVTSKTNETSATAKQKAQCVSLSTDDDFFKLRRDMAAKSNEDEMRAQAKKYFKGKCYRTEQIKFLSTLFLTDEGKYRFFDAAYMHVSDQEKFTSLQSEIIDSYFVNRFKALIAN